MQPMIRLILCSFLTLIFTRLNSQILPVQTIRGQVLDEISKSPIQGATIYLAGDSAITNMTDQNGSFSLLNVPVGRQAVIISSIGYERQVINEILVTSGKEVIINTSLTEKITHLNEVVIKAINKRTVKNDMITVSGRAFNADDTRKYAGSLGDPSRMVAAFAGVSSSDDSRK